MCVWYLDTPHSVQSGCAISISTRSVDGSSLPSSSEGCPWLSKSDEDPINLRICLVSDSGETAFSTPPLHRGLARAFLESPLSLRTNLTNLKIALYPPVVLNLLIAGTKYLMETAENLA